MFDFGSQDLDPSEQSHDVLGALRTCFVHKPLWKVVTRKYVTR